VESSKAPAAESSAGYAGAFGGFDGRIWLNAAHQGPLPLLATEAAGEALAAKPGISPRLPELANLERQRCAQPGTTRIGRE